jgi:D-methionine transport system permease protein
LLIGTSIGTTATIVPLSIAAAPFVARVIETALKEVDPGVVQAARAMGSTNMQIVRKVLIPEALPSLVSGVTLTIINLIGYSAMAGAIGGGGLGDLAIRYGYQRFRGDIMVVAVVVILVLVEVIQVIGNKISAKLLARR